MNDHRYPTNCYTMLKTVDDVGNQTLILHVKNFLLDMGLVLPGWPETYITW